jgi:CHAT domain-containing protein/tetratricopeptide (TPR) repeat protein
MKLTPGDHSLIHRSFSRAARVVLLLATLVCIQEHLNAHSDVTEPKARDAFAEAERLRAEWNEKSLRSALEKYKEALLYWRAHTDKANEARVAERIGQVYVLFGENQDALTYYKRALKLSRAVRNTPLRVEALNRLCSIYAFQGATPEALHYCNRALLLSRRSGDQRGKAQALNNTGEAHYFSDLKIALTLFEQALAQFKANGDQRGQAHTLTNIGHVYTDWSDLQKALTYYNQALTLWPATGDRSGEARTRNALGVLHSKLGEKQKAFTAHTEASEMFNLIGNRPGVLTALTGIGHIYDSMGQKEEALRQYSAALEIARMVGQREGELVLLIHVGNVLQASDRKDEALEKYETAFNLSQALHDKWMQAYSLTFLGEIHEASADQKKAELCYKRALSLSRRSEDKRGEAFALNHLAYVYEYTGKRELALKHYDSALKLHLATKDREAEALTRYRLAATYYDRGDLEEARAEVEKALGIVESLRTYVGSHELRVSYFASVQQYYSLYINVLMQMHKTRPADRLDIAAFQASGRARARNLLDLLSEAHADLYQSIEPSLKEKEQTLGQTLSAKSERQIRLLSGEYSEEEAAELEKEIGDLSFELENVRAQIRERSPRYSALTENQPLSLENVQEMLDENTLLLEYALGQKRSYLWAVDRNGINTYELPDRAKIEEIARRLYGLLSTRHFKEAESLSQYEARAREIDEQYWRDALELGKIVLGPVSQQLGAKRLLIVADGALLLVPFSALALSTTTEQEPVPLVLEHDIVSLPSAAALAALRKMTAQRPKATKAVAVLADPVYEKDDPRLTAEAGKATKVAHTTDVKSPANHTSLIDTGSRIARLMASAEEAEEIVQMAPRGGGLKAVGFEANLDTVSGPAIAQYRIVHFAAHGTFNNEHPELSGIILSLYDRQARPRAGFLRLQEIYNLNLPVDLIVLSACDTALGKEVEGEGLIGLTRGFMYAGAAGVMASLWKVDEDATAELMKHFYAGIFKDGLTPATALRKAQIKMWQTGRRRSPYYWAAFVLHGEYQQATVIDQHDSKRAQIAVGLSILLASSLGMYLARRRRIARNRF